LFIYFFIFGLFIPAVFHFGTDNFIKT
jgi:hypothetical protein